MMNPEAKDAAARTSSESLKKDQYNLKESIQCVGLLCKLRHKTGRAASILFLRRGQASVEP